MLSLFLLRSPVIKAFLDNIGSTLTRFLLAKKISNLVRALWTIKLFCNKKFPIYLNKNQNQVFLSQFEICKYYVFILACKYNNLNELFMPGI